MIADINIRVTTRGFQLDAHTPLGAFVLEFEVAILPLLDRSLYPLVSLQLLCLHGCISGMLESTLLTTYGSAHELSWQTHALAHTDTHVCNTLSLRS